MRKLALLFALLITLLPAYTQAQTRTASLSVQPNSLLGEWFLARVGAPVAWAHGADGHGIKVLVIDTGVDASIATQVLTGTMLPGWTFSARYPSYNDNVGHGTFVVTEIAGHGLGYLGICPKCQVAMARVFGKADSADTKDISRAYMWGVIHGFKVISLSLGGSQYPNDLASAVAYGATQGVQCVAAAGNNGNAAFSYPAALPGCLAVAATDYNDKPTSWSSYGSDVGISAPGDLIAGFLPCHIGNLIPGCGLSTISGTSMATPLVAGAIADLMSLGMTPENAVVYLTVGARWVPGWDRTNYGRGILDLTGALRADDL